MLFERKFMIQDSLLNKKGGEKHDHLIFDQKSQINANNLFDSVVICAGEGERTLYFCSYNKTRK